MIDNTVKMQQKLSSLIKCMIEQNLMFQMKAFHQRACAIETFDFVESFKLVIGIFTKF